jgi:hypothetical protein
MAHMVSGQDLLIADKLRGGTSLHESGWAAKTGIPLERPNIWQRDSWRMNLSGFDAYRLAVTDNTRRYLQALTPEELGREVAWIRGPEQPIHQLLRTILINHALGHCGEISTLKGIQGLKGLPI